VANNVIYTRRAIKNILDKVRDARPEGIELFMIVASPNDEPPRVVRASIGKDVGTFFLENVQHALERKLAHEDLSLLEYEPLLQPDTESILYDEIGNVPLLGYILEEMRRSDLPVFSLDDVDSLRAYAIRITKGIVAFKKYSATKLLQQSKFIAILGEDGTFNKVKGTAAALDRTIDCLSSPTGVFVLSSAAAFESMFDQTKAIVSFVEGHAQDLTALGLVDDVGPLMELCMSDQYKRKKLYKVLSRSELLKRLKPAAIAEAARRRKLDLEFDASGHAIIDTPQRAREYLKLLDEDFFSGEWTGLEYGAHSKELR
jgi:hypothetical protein